MILDIIKDIMKDIRGVSETNIIICTANVVISDLCGKSR